MDLNFGINDYKRMKHLMELQELMLKEKEILASIKNFPEKQGEF
jgi:hypothetical protein